MVEALDTEMRQILSSVWDEPVPEEDAESIMRHGTSLATAFGKLPPTNLSRRRSRPRSRLMRGAPGLSVHRPPSIGSQRCGTFEPR
jgi:hypothetical protein